MAADAVAVEPLKASVRVAPAQFAQANRGVSGKVWTKSLNLSSGLQNTQCIMNQILQSYQAVHIAWLGNARAEVGGFIRGMKGLEIEKPLYIKYISQNIRIIGQHWFLA